MTDARFARLASRALISVTGEGWRTFLQGLITNDVERLAPGEMRFAALLTPQGRFLFDMFVIARANGCLLDIQAGRRDALIQRLTMYRLRARVDIEAAPGGVFVLFSPSSDSAGGSAPPDATGEAWVADPRLAGLGWRCVDPVLPSTLCQTDEAAYDAHRLALGVPDPAQDCIPDKTYPLEADFDLLGGIDFQKGCFVGQETTSRMKRRGAIKSRMLPIAFEGSPPPFGAEVLAGDLRAGEVLSGEEGRAMALLRLDRIEGAVLTVEGRAVEARRPAWFDHPGPK